LCEEAESVYNYCYKPDGKLYLCKTYGYADDEKCKHVWLCNQASGICAAGIITLIDKETPMGETIQKVFIDLISGSYITEMPGLEILKADLLNTIPGLDIVLLDFYRPMTERERHQYVNDYVSYMIDILRLANILPDLRLTRNWILKHLLITRKEEEFQENDRAWIRRHDQEENKLVGGRRKTRRKKMRKTKRRRLY
jgi:hypothetical protein